MNTSHTKASILEFIHPTFVSIVFYKPIYYTCCYIQWERENVRGLTLHSEKPESCFTTGRLCIHSFFNS